MSPARKLNDRNPFEMYLLGAALLTSIPPAVGLTLPPNSIAQQLPGWPARLWAFTLFAGCVTAFVGLAWPRPPWPMVSVTALGLEQVGLTIAGAATTVYGSAALATAGLVALVPAGLSLAFGLACFAQAWKIRQILRVSRPVE